MQYFVWLGFIILFLFDEDSTVNSVYQEGLYFQETQLLLFIGIGSNCTE